VRKRLSTTDKWRLAGAAFLVLFIGYIVFDRLFEKYWPPMPGPGDRRLVGKWIGTAGYYQDKMLLEFKADGTGSSRTIEHPKWQTVFDWGTNDGVLHLRWLATDHWPRRTRAYVISANGNVITIEGKGNYAFPERMVRQ
jgi:hypothetical protein